MNSELLKIIDDFLEFESSTYARIFLIKKSKHADMSKKFHAQIFEIDDDIKPDFNSIANVTLNDIKDNHKKIKKFSDPHITQEYRTLKKNTFPEIEALLNELETQEDLSLIDSLKLMEKNDDVYCFQYKINHKRLFFFAKINKYVVPENEHNIVAKFDHNILKKHRDEFIIFDKQVFSIYVEDLETLLMINYSDTKKLLSFKSLFKNKCKEILIDELSDIFICDPNNMDSILNNNKTNEALIKMSESHVIDENRSHYKQWNDFCDTHTLEKVSKINLDDENGSPTINTSSELRMALYVSNNDIMQGVVRPGEYALVFSKEILNQNGSNSARN